MLPVTTHISSQFSTLFSLYKIGSMYFTIVSGASHLNLDKQCYSGLISVVTSLNWCIVAKLGDEAVTTHIPVWTLAGEQA